MNTLAGHDLRIEHAPQTLREIAVSRLRGAIVSGRFGSGERLVERTLGENLGVSRTVVREAIRYLEAEGLVEIEPRVGPIVARLSWNDARQIYDIRLLLEAAAAADCARRADDAVRNALSAALSRLQDAARQDPATLHEATTVFYEAIFRAAGHDIAWKIVQSLNGRISRLRMLTLATEDRRVSGPMRMDRICRAICSGDPVAAAQEVRDHLTEAAALARRILEPSEA